MSTTEDRVAEKLWRSWLAGYIAGGKNWRAGSERLSTPAGKEHHMVVDMTYSLEHIEDMAIFSAHTKKGEAFMGGHEVSMPATSADQYKDAATQRGLNALSFHNYAQEALLAVLKSWRSCRNAAQGSGLSRPRSGGYRADHFDVPAT
jgi:hypothetical protein